MTSLKKHLESLSNPAPSLPDIEDAANVDGSAARLVSDGEQDYAETDHLQPRRIRLPINLDEEDARYGGKAVKSSDIFGNERAPLTRRNTELDESDEESDEEEMEDEMEAGTDDETSDKGSENAEDAMEYQSEEEGDDDAGFTTMRQSDESAKRSEAVRAQLILWDRLMHLTIKLHGSMRTFNRLPRGKVAKELLERADEATQQQYRKLKKSAFDAAQLLFAAEQSLARRTAGDNSDKHNDTDDEEIESSDDEDQAEQKDLEAEDDDEFGSMPSIEGGRESHTKNSKTPTAPHVEALASKLQRNDRNFDKFRNTTLTKWDERTRLIGKKSSKKDFSALESAIVNQIQKVLADRSRLISRTQTKRSDFDRIGSDPEAAQDPEIFDDDDFHQSLLKDFIEQKSAQTTDPIAMSRQWLEVQKLRQKRSKHKVVDTRASKGRKIRYVTIPKLVNFYPAMPEVVSWSHEKRNELFKSLFL